MRGSPLPPFAEPPEPDATEGFPGAAPQGSTAPIAAPGQTLGRYVVIEPLGQGGMGVVLRAYDPKLQREVALKCLRPGLLSPDMQARMVREAQAMAKLNHRNVVAIYDVELAGDQVVLAMELVRGATLRAWLEAERRSWRAVVTAFIGAGLGLQAAHEAGLLHRDFKPENVLMAIDDEPKVTDFGIAHSIEGARERESSSLMPSADAERDSLGFGSRLTAAGQRVGTPAFMAPEQLRGDENLGPGVDQYGLCVSLWHALTGQFPFVGSARERLARQLEGPPAWPKSASRVPRRIVETIVRGLAPDPDARWPSMAVLCVELSFDPTRQRRRRLAVAALASSGLATGGWLALDHVLTTNACQDEGQALRQTWNPDRADVIASAFGRTGLTYAADTWQRTRDRVDGFAAEWQAARTRACRRGELDHDWDEVTLARSRWCLDEMQLRLDILVRQWSEPDAGIVGTSATAAWGLPEPAGCLDEAELAKTEFTEEGSTSEAVQALRLRLAEASALVDTAQYAKALPIVEEGVEVANRLGRPRLVAAALLSRGELRDKSGLYDAAAEDFKEAFAAAESSGDDGQALRAASMLIYLEGNQQGRYDAAQRWFWLAEAKQERLGLSSEDPRVAALLNNAAAVQSRHGHFDAALTYYLRTLEIREHALGPDHPEVAGVLQNIANVQSDLMRLDDALPAYVRALSIYEHALGPEHPLVATVLNGIANVHHEQTRFGDALSLYYRALSIYEKTLGADHPDVGMVLNNIGNVHEILGSAEHALAFYLRALSIFEKALGSQHPHVAALLSNVSHAYVKGGRLDEGLSLALRALAVFEKVLGSEHPSVAQVLRDIGDTHALAERFDAALTAYLRAIAIREQAFGRNHPKVAEVLLAVAKIHVARGQSESALPLLERALDIRLADDASPAGRAEVRWALARALGPSPTGLQHARQALVDAEPDSGLRIEIQAWLCARSPADTPDCAGR